MKTVLLYRSESWNDRQPDQQAPDMFLIDADDTFRTSGNLRRFFQQH